MIDLNNFIKRDFPELKINPCPKCGSRLVFYYRDKLDRIGFVGCSACWYTSNLYRYANRAIFNWNQKSVNSSFLQHLN